MGGIINPEMIDAIDAYSTREELFSAGELSTSQLKALYVGVPDMVETCINCDVACAKAGSDIKFPIKYIDIRKEYVGYSVNCKFKNLKYSRKIKEIFNLDEKNDSLEDAKDKLYNVFIGILRALKNNPNIFLT